MITKPDLSGNLADHIQELHQRVAFVDLVVTLMVEHPSPDALVTVDCLSGFCHVTRDLALLTEAVRDRVCNEA